MTQLGSKGGDVRIVNFRASENAVNTAAIEPKHYLQVEEVVLYESEALNQIFITSLKILPTHNFCVAVYGDSGKRYPLANPFSRETLSCIEPSEILAPLF